MNGVVSILSTILDRIVDMCYSPRLLDEIIPDQRNGGGNIALTVFVRKMRYGA